MVGHKQFVWWYYARSVVLTLPMVMSQCNLEMYHENNVEDIIISDDKYKLNDDIFKWQTFSYQ